MTEPNHASLIASIAAHQSWADTPDPADRAARTANARKKAWERFEHEVDPNGVLAPRDRAIAAENARLAYFKTLALKSAKARAARKVAKPPRETILQQRLAELDASGGVA